MCQHLQSSVLVPETKDRSREKDRTSTGRRIPEYTEKEVYTHVSFFFSLKREQTRIFLRLWQPSLRVVILEQIGSNEEISKVGTHISVTPNPEVVHLKFSYVCKSGIVILLELNRDPNSLREIFETIWSIVPQCNDRYKSNIYVCRSKFNS